MPRVPSLASPKIEQGEDEDPYEVDEVPVETGDLDDLITALAAREEAGRALVEIAAPYLAGDDQKENHADRHVRPVEARNHEKGGAELRRSPWIAPRANAFVNELRPLEGLHADEGGAEDRRHDHQDGSLHAVAPIA